MKKTTPGAIIIAVPATKTSFLSLTNYYAKAEPPLELILAVVELLLHSFPNSNSIILWIVAPVIIHSMGRVSRISGLEGQGRILFPLFGGGESPQAKAYYEDCRDDQSTTRKGDSEGRDHAPTSLLERCFSSITVEHRDDYPDDQAGPLLSFVLQNNSTATNNNNNDRGRRSNKQQRRPKRSRARREGASPESAMVGRSSQATPQKHGITAPGRSISTTSSVATTGEVPSFLSFFNMTSAPSEQRQQNPKTKTVNKRQETSKTATKPKRRQRVPKLDIVLEDALSDKENSFSEEPGNNHSLTRKPAKEGSNASGVNVDGGMLGHISSFANTKRERNVATGNGLMGFVGVVHKRSTERPSKPNSRNTKPAPSRKPQNNVEITTTTSTLLGIKPIPPQKTQNAKRQQQQTDWGGLMGVVEQNIAENPHKASALNIKAAPPQMTQKVSQHQNQDSFMGIMGVVDDKNTEKPTKATSQVNKPATSSKAPKAKRSHDDSILESAAPKLNSETHVTRSSVLITLEPPVTATETRFDVSIKEQTLPQNDEKQLVLDKAKAKSSWLDIERKSLRKSLSLATSTEATNEPKKSRTLAPTKTQTTETTKLIKRKRPPAKNNTPEIPFWALASGTVPIENEVLPSPLMTECVMMNKPKETASALLNSSIADMSSPESTATNTNSVKITEEKQPNRKLVQSTSPIAFPGSLVSNGDMMDNSERDTTVEKTKESDEVDLDASPRCDALTPVDDAPDDVDITHTSPVSIDKAATATTVSTPAMEAKMAKPEVAKSLTPAKGRVTRQSSRRDSNPEKVNSIKPTKGRVTRQRSRRKSNSESNSEFVSSPKPSKGRITRQRSRRESSLLPWELQKSLLDLEDKAFAGSKEDKSDLPPDKKNQKKSVSQRFRKSKSSKSPNIVIELLGSSEEDSPIVIKSKKGKHRQEDKMMDSSSESESDSDDLVEAHDDGIAPPRTRITRSARKAKTNLIKKEAVARRRQEQAKPKDKQNRIANAKHQKKVKLSKNSNSAVKEKEIANKQLSKVTRRHSNRQRSKPSRFSDIFAEDVPIKTMESPSSDCEEKESSLGKRKERSSDSLTGAPKTYPPVTDQKNSTPIGVDNGKEDEVEEASPNSSIDEDSSSDENWNYEMSPILLSSLELNTKPAATKKHSVTSIDSPNIQQKKPKVCFDVEEADNRPLLQDQLHPSAPIFSQIRTEGLGSKPELKAAIVSQLEQSTKPGSHAYSNLEKAAGNTYLRMILHQPPVITAVEEDQEQHEDKISGKSAKTSFRKPARLVVNTETDSRMPNETDEPDWSSDEISLLKTAYRLANALSRTFWVDVAAQIAGRTPAGCRQKWFSLVKTPPRKVYGNKKSSFNMPVTFDNSDDDSEEDNEEDILDSAPTGNAAAASKSNHAFAGLDIGAGSPIRFNKTKLVEAPPIDEEDEEMEVGDIREKPGYVSYIRACQKKIRMAKRQGHGKKNQAKKNKKALSKVAEHYGDGDVAVNGNLSPGGTLRVQTLYEEEDENIVFRDDDDAESEDELL